MEKITYLDTQIAAFEVMYEASSQIPNERPVGNGLNIVMREGRRGSGSHAIVMIEGPNRRPSVALFINGEAVILPVKNRIEGGQTPHLRLVK